MEKNYIIAGFGGQGVLFAGKVLANAFMITGKNVTWYPCYGAEMRGGTVNCEIVVSDDEVSSVHKQDVDCVIALNQLSFDKFLPKIKSDGVIICNSSLIEKVRPRDDIKYIFIPMTNIASETGNNKLSNMVSLGVLSSSETILNNKVFEKALDLVLPDNRKKFLPSNISAIQKGIEAVLQTC